MGFKRTLIYISHPINRDKKLLSLFMTQCAEIKLACSNETELLDEEEC